MRGPLTPLPMYTFMLWTGATLPFTADAVRGQSVIAETLVQYQISMCVEFVVHKLALVLPSLLVLLFLLF